MPQRELLGFVNALIEWGGLGRRAGGWENLLGEMWNVRAFSLSSFFFFFPKVQCLISDVLLFNTTPVLLGCEITPFLAKCCSVPSGGEGASPLRQAESRPQGTEGWEQPHGRWAPLPRGHSVCAVRQRSSACRNQGKEPSGLLWATLALLLADLQARRETAEAYCP